MNTYKRRMIIFAVAIVVVVGLFVWGKSNHKNIDSLPSLEQVAQMTDEAVVRYNGAIRQSAEEFVIYPA